MSKPTILFWDGEKVIEYFGENHAEAVAMTVYTGMPAVDLKYPVGTSGRTGIYHPTTGWEGCGTQELPSKFRANLLLLGID